MFRSHSAAPARTLPIDRESADPRAPAQMDPVQLQILRVALYELIELGAPPHVISEHVDLTKALVFPQAGGFTNGAQTCRSLYCVPIPSGLPSASLCERQGERPRVTPAAEWNCIARKFPNAKLVGTLGTLRLKVLRLLVSDGKPATLLAGVLRSAAQRRDAGTLPAPALPSSPPPTLDAAQASRICLRKQRTQSAVLSDCPLLLRLTADVCVRVCRCNWPQPASPCSVKTPLSACAVPGGGAGHRNVAPDVDCGTVGGAVRAKGGLRAAAGQQQARNLCHHCSL